MVKHGLATESQNSNSDMTSILGTLGGTLGTLGTSHHGGFDGPVLPITGHKLNGNNFPQWAQSVMMYVCGKGKDDYLTGEISTPAKEDLKFKTWKAENMMVMSWLINSMTTEVGENFMFYSTAKEMWDVARETYSDNENTSELIEIKGILHDLRQGDMSVTQYFNILTRHWQQLDMFETSTWDSPGDAKKYRKIVERE